jgi:hypothetical protein
VGWLCFPTQRQNTAQDGVLRQLSVQNLLSSMMSVMKPEFLHLNLGWSAEPNAPEPHVEVQGSDIILRFYVNPSRFKELEEDEHGFLRFVNCAQYRLGSTNDEGWDRGQCRFSPITPKWGEFYESVMRIRSSKRTKRLARTQDKNRGRTASFPVLFPRWHFRMCRGTLRH